MLSCLRDAAKRLIYAVLLTLLLVGCASSPGGRVISDLPPAELLQDCPVPDATLETNGALAQWALSLKYSLQVCNDDKAALRSWAERAAKGN